LALLAIAHLVYNSELCSTIQQNNHNNNDMDNIFLLNMSSDEFFNKLKECFAEAMFSPEADDGVKVKKHYVYGLQGICDLFGCSIATAARIKKSGVIDAAISQVGNTIVVDADLAIDLLKVRKNKPNRRK